LDIGGQHEMNSVVLVRTFYAAFEVVDLNWVRSNPQGSTEPFQGFD